jgi:hypothetical protein
MPNQALPALTRYGVAVALLLSSACGKEREPWFGFELFPGADASLDGTAGTAAEAFPDATSNNSGSSAPSSTDTSEGTSGPATAPAAGSGGGSRGPTQPTTSTGGVQTGTPDLPDAPGEVVPGAAPMSFRITELQLRDPHVFAGTTDITEQQVLGQSVNRTLIPDKLTKDADGDGAIDVSVVALLAPFDPTAAPGGMATLTFVNASCPVSGGANGTCKPLAGNKGLETTWTLEQRQSGNCLEPMQGTTSNYQPAIAIPSGPCFLSAEGNDLTMDLGGIKIDVIAARVSAAYQSQPAGLVKGLLAGFVTRTAAEQATLPSVAGSMVGGESLSTYIRARDYDQSASPNGQDGFWMYLNFVAKPITYTP